jgi:hypothetical protein
MCHLHKLQQKHSTSTDSKNRAQEMVLPQRELRQVRQLAAEFGAPKMAARAGAQDVALARRLDETQRTA